MKIEHDYAGPLSAEEFFTMDELEKTKDIQSMYVFGDKKIRPLFVIVETWEHRNYGRGKREYLKEFSESERKTLGKWRTKLYDWYMRRGIPYKGVMMKLPTYNLLCRAAYFFSTI